MTASKRIEFIDLSKIIAILLIMISHTGVLPNTINVIFNGFYITVFFICAGYCYGKENRIYKSIKQVRKILFYYIIFSFIIFFVYYLFSYFFMGVVDFNRLIISLKGILYSRYSNGQVLFFNMENGPLWFMTCYIITYLIFVFSFRISDHFKINKYVNLILLITIGYILINTKLLPWSIDTAPYMSIFMYIGYFFKEQDEEMNLWSTILLFAIYLILTKYVGGINYSIKVYGNNYFMTMFYSIVGSILFIKIMKYLCKIKIFQRISLLGKYSMYYMAFHVLIYWIIELFIKLDNRVYFAFFKLLISGVLCLAIGYVLSKMIDSIGRKKRNDKYKNVSCDT